ncbi:unnamed protein product [Nippostrongylus brasiliensis]|uniref:CTNA1 n=1 Tax=Nippostrongylus brasiliensis TaxID=27835 RepID=A0A0N4XDM0_NIPBR|nr:unnamed protein product [Nippostrongylus brasiliensis]
MLKNTQMVIIQKLKALPEASLWEKSSKADEKSVKNLEGKQKVLVDHLVTITKKGRSAHTPSVMWKETKKSVDDAVPMQREQQKKFKELAQNAARRDARALHLLKNTTNAGYIRTLLKKAKSQLIEVQWMKSTETKIATLGEALSGILSALKRFFAVELCTGAEGNGCITAREEIAQAALNVEDVIAEHSVSTFDGFVQQAIRKNNEAVGLLRKIDGTRAIRELLCDARKSLREVRRAKNTKAQISPLREALGKNIGALQGTTCNQEKGNDCISAREEMAEATLDITLAIEAICGSELAKMKIDGVLMSFNPSNLESYISNVGSELASLSQQC